MSREVARLKFLIIEKQCSVSLYFMCLTLIVARNLPSHNYTLLTVECLGLELLGPDE